jgi:hypothetical protein
MQSQDTREAAGPQLSVPDAADMDVLTAALAYAAAGWYSVPVRRGTKNPGSVLGDGWQHQSSREPEVLAAWLAGTDHGIALHAGRSGAVLLDVDHPEALSGPLSALADGAGPYQETRPGSPGRGHHPFLMPPGRMLGNGLGRLPRGWGEIRGANGVIVVQPSEHPDGGRYRWLRHGPVPELPAAVAELLDNASPGADAATDAQVATFLQAHKGLRDPGGSAVCQATGSEGHRPREPRPGGSPLWQPLTHPHPRGTAALDFQAGVVMTAYIDQLPGVTEVVSE